MGRAEILASIARSAGLRPAADLPDLAGPWTSYGGSPRERREAFARAVEEAGGRCVVVASHAEVAERMEEATAVIPKPRCVSAVPGLGDSWETIQPSIGTDPSTLADIEWAVLPGAFGVAENGAVWVRGEALPHRALIVLPQRIALVLPADALVDHLHHAYARLRFEGRGFGSFLCGPSKTADIEQALVIGAHGARSLTVFLVETREPDA